MKVIRYFRKLILGYDIFISYSRDDGLDYAYKIADVVPLFKSGTKEDPNCYRPVSLLPTIGKLFEKLISLRMIKNFLINMTCQNIS